jgi:alpha-glucosidase (family GH31 glycosyl hydrolase)
VAPGLEVRHAAALLLLACAAACSGDGDGLPASYELAAPGIRVTIARKPYHVTVADTAGHVVLDGLAAGAGDGYGALGFTTGTIDIHSTITPGYFRADLKLDAWRDGFEIVAASATATTLEATLATPAGDRVTVKHAVTPSTLRVEARRDGATRAWSAAFRAPAGEGYLGMGERFTRTNFRGLSLYSWLEEGGIGGGVGSTPGEQNPYPNGESMSYYPVPFFIATEGYAVWLDTTWYNRVDFASEKPDAWRLFSAAPTLAYEVYVPIPGDARPWPYQLIDLFTARTGRPMVPPRWAFGPRRRINRGALRDGVPELQRMRELDLAITIIDDNLHFLPSGITADERNSAMSFIPQARALGARVVGYFNSFFSVRPTDPVAPLVAVGLENGYFLKDAGGQLSQGWILSGSTPLYLDILDFTSLAATAWYQKLFDQALDLGYSGWMYDFGEYVQPDVVSASGMSGEQLHNLYPVLYQKAAHDYLEVGPHAGDWLTYVRSGYTGAAQYSPTAWSGDPAASFESADGLPSMVRGAINIGIAGVPNWGGDIGGYHCVIDGAEAADGELLARWIEQGSMEPGMHDEDACVGGNGPKASIWSSPDAQAAWKTYARLHTRLFPYFYTLSQQAHETGAPIIRHLFLEHPDRADLAGVDDAYYVGPGIFVAPVLTRGARTRTVALPAGNYLDWDAGVLRSGTVMLDAPLGRLPLLLRDNQLVPMLDASIDTLDDETSPDIVGPADVADAYDVVGLVSKAASFTLWDGGALSATVSGAFAAPSLPAAASEAELATCAGCWRTDALAGMTRARISATGDVTAGGLALHAAVGRRVRWDLYLPAGGSTSQPRP